MSRRGLLGVATLLRPVRAHTGRVSVGPEAGRFAGRAYAGGQGAPPVRHVGAMTPNAQILGDPYCVLGPVPQGRVWMLERLVGEYGSTTVVGNYLSLVNVFHQDPRIALAAGSSDVRRIAALQVVTPNTSIDTIEFQQPVKLEAGDWVAVNGSTVGIDTLSFQYLDYALGATP